MKYLTIVYDGMADRPISELGGMTPMEKANKPTMDMLARTSYIGTVSNVPQGMVPESDTANLAILSYDPKVYSKGRSPLEAMSMGLSMSPRDVAYRTNIVALSEEEEKYEDRRMLDHSADEISTEEADILIKTLDEKLGDKYRRFFTGVSYRHCMLYDGGTEKTVFMRPHDIIGKTVGEYMPSGEDCDTFISMMKESYEILKDHPVNAERRKRGLKAGNSLWFWSPGRKPALPSFYHKWGLKGSVISAVDLIKGIAICAGMESIDVAGATGNVHTNYEGKAQAAIEAFKNDADLVFIHVEAPDECGHRAEIENKVLSIEYIDSRILAKVYDYLKGCGEDYAIMCLPDHPTPIEIRTHSMEPVPFMIYRSNKRCEGTDCFTEKNAESAGVYMPAGTELMTMLLGKKPKEY